MDERDNLTTDERRVLDAYREIRDELIVVRKDRHGRLRYIRVQSDRTYYDQRTGETYPPQQD